MDNQFKIGQIVTSTLKQAEGVTILELYYDETCDCWFYQVEYKGEKRYVQESVLKLV